MSLTLADRARLLVNGLILPLNINSIFIDIFNIVETVLATFKNTMTHQSYIGIDCTDNGEWIAVVWTDGKVILSRSFKNAPTDLDSLVRFVTERCAQPKICLKLANPASLNLTMLISAIPEVEVVLISEAGLRLHRYGLQKTIPAPFPRHNFCQAYLLAYCAGRII